MSMQVIVFAAIAILILIIIVFLIGKSSSGLVKGTKCIEAGGRCQANCDNDPVLDPEAGESCASSGQICCKLVPG